MMCIQWCGLDRFACPVKCRLHNYTGKYISKLVIVLWGALSSALLVAQDASLQIRQASVPESQHKAYLDLPATVLKSDLVQLQAQLKLMQPQSDVVQQDHQTYIWRKAMAWVEVGLDELRNLNAGPFPIAAYEQASRLKQLLQTKPFDQQTWLQAQQTPMIQSAPKLRQDIWDAMQFWQLLSIESAPITQYAARCTLADMGVLEVYLAHASWVNVHSGWRSAQPYIAKALRQKSKLEQHFIRCRNEQAAKQTELLKVNIK